MGQKAVPSASNTKGATIRVSGFQASTRAHALRKTSTGMDGNTSPSVPKQASVNKGPMTQFSAGTQKLGRTQTPKPPSKPSQTGQPRSTQSTMTGKGSKAG